MADQMSNPEANVSPLTAAYLEISDVTSAVKEVSNAIASLKGIVKDPHDDGSTANLPREGFERQIHDSLDHAGKAIDQLLSHLDALLIRHKTELARGNLDMFILAQAWVVAEEKTAEAERNKSLVKARETKVTARETKVKAEEKKVTARETKVKARERNVKAKWTKVKAMETKVKAIETKVKAMEAKAVADAETLKERKIMADKKMKDIVSLMRAVEAKRKLVEECEMRIEFLEEKGQALKGNPVNLDADAAVEDGAEVSPALARECQASGPVEGRGLGELKSGEEHALGVMESGTKGKDAEAELKEKRVFEEFNFNADAASAAAGASSRPPGPGEKPTATAENEDSSPDHLDSSITPSFKGFVSQNGSTVNADEIEKLWHREALVTSGEDQLRRYSTHFHIREVNVIERERKVFDRERKVSDNERKVSDNERRLEQARHHAYQWLNAMQAMTDKGRQAIQSVRGPLPQQIYDSLNLAALTEGRPHVQVEEVAIFVERFEMPLVMTVALLVKIEEWVEGVRGFIAPMGSRNEGVGREVEGVKDEGGKDEGVKDEGGKDEGDKDEGERMRVKRVKVEVEGGKNDGVKNDDEKAEGGKDDGGKVEGEKDEGERIMVKRMKVEDEGGKDEGEIMRVKRMKVDRG